MHVHVYVYWLRAGQSTHMQIIAVPHLDTVRVAKNGAVHGCRRCTRVSIRLLASNQSSRFSAITPLNCCTTIAPPTRRRSTPRKIGMKVAARCEALSSSVDATHNRHTTSPRRHAEHLLCLGGALCTGYDHEK